MKPTKSERSQESPTRRKSKSQLEQEAATDAALERLEISRDKAPAISNLHMHIDAPKSSRLSTWLRIAAGLGIPAIILEILRQFVL